ncbi:hypothetical protein AVEN_171050-1 [Araneus ventricosus]|uniref:CCHC-type domain-containing protein n=1 Tax=Araneus ventricosus TaxID=182803 RepID=A0A4Y2N268_ARAVE|nr:hypothetical protein AVEN_171050-1 [Araneus ventricosus]
MSISAGARKCDLKILAKELGETVNDSHKLKDLKKMILASKEYDEESAKEWLNTIINERKEREENERRNEEIQITERRRQEEIEQRKQEYEERKQKEEQEYEERKRKEEYNEPKRKGEMEFELQKIRLGAEGRSSNSNSVSNQNVNIKQIKPKLEIHHLMKKFNSDENDIILYLITFKRLAKQVEKVENTWKFFNEWVNGVKADSFEKLSDQIITDQIKRKVTQEVKDHFIDEWSKLNSPDDLVEKLDDYDTLRSTFRSKRPRKERHYDKQNSLIDDPAVTTNERKKLYGITHNERGEPKCFNCSNFGHIARNCSLPKSVLTRRECNETCHKAINCDAKETNHSSDESLSVRQVDEKLDKSNAFLKKAKLNNCDNVQALMDTGSLCCLLKISVAQKFKLKLERAVNQIYGFGNQNMLALTSMRIIKADVEVDNVKAENISIYVVPDDAQSLDLIIGRTWLDLPHIAYTKLGKRVHIVYREDELFRNFLIEKKVNPVCLKHLETAQSESESLHIKDFSQQKMIGNLANDLKMEKNENVENLKSNNDSLVKTNAYYVKRKSGKLLFRKGEIVAVRRNPKATGESTKTEPRYRGPMVVTEILPSDTYRISQLEPSNSRLYATTAHVSQLKTWKSWNEDDDDSSTNSDDEPEIQRLKRTVFKLVPYADFMSDR